MQATHKIQRQLYTTHRWRYTTNHKARQEQGNQDRLQLPRRPDSRDHQDPTLPLSNTKP